MEDNYIRAAQQALENVKRQAAQGNFISSYRVEDPNDISAVFQHFLLLGQSPVERWQIERAEVVPVRLLREVVLRASDRRRAIRNAYPKDCYRNAIKVCKKLGAAYCEGWVSGPGVVFIRHAWNGLDGTHFDVTAEQFLNWPPDSTIYVLALALPAQEALTLWKQRNGFDFSGGEVLSSIYWRKHHCTA